MTILNYLWDKDSYLEEYDENGVATATYSNEPTSFGNVISQRKNSSSNFYHYDAQGSTHQLTDESENVSDTFLYDAWGNKIVQTGTTTIPFRYIGEFGYYYDEETESYYVRARNYAPVTGRWLSADPLGFLETLVQYLYALNAPGGNIDPSGLLSKGSSKDILIACVFNNFGEIQGSVEAGDLSDRTLSGCAKELIDNIRGAGITSKFSDVIEEALIWKPLGKIPGLSASNKFRLNMIKALRKHLKGKNPDEVFSGELVKDLVSELGGNLSSKQKKALSDYLKKLLQDGKSFSIGTCQSVKQKWKKKTTSGDGAGAGTTSQSAECDFLVCATVEFSWFGLSETVKEWSVNGGCNYTCSPADRCCCGTSFNFFISASGSASGQHCKVDKKKIEGQKS